MDKGEEEKKESEDIIKLNVIDINCKFLCVVQVPVQQQHQQKVTSLGEIKK